MKNNANILTISRLVFSVILLATRPLSIPFFVVYTWCGISDILDGMIARKTHTQSQFGARLDSVADVLMFCVSAIKLVPVVLSDLSKWHIYFIVGIAIIRVTAYIIGSIRFHRFVSLHTLLNKMTGVLLFLFPFLICIMNISIVIWIICGVAFVSALEELLCQMLLREYNPDVRNIFEVKK